MNKHNFKVGDVLVSSWGYDQTNVDFYKVVRVMPATIVLREIAADVKSKPGSFMCGESTPALDCEKQHRFTGAEFKARVGSSESFCLNGYKYVRRWDGQPKYTSWYA